MLARVFTATTIGLDPQKIEVEIDGIRGQPNLLIIGLPSKSVDESKERITAALLHCGYTIKAKRTIVNLAPADLRKEGSTFELAIAIGMLKMYGMVKENTDKMMFFGELSLNGELKPVRGALPLTLAARQMGFTTVFLPAANTIEVSLVDGITIFPAAHLQDIIDHLNHHQLLSVLAVTPYPQQTVQQVDITMDDIVGQEHAKRALLIAAAGGHNILLSGPPGAGKSMMAKALCSVLPALTIRESLAVTSIYSVAGKIRDTLITQRPFRSPHHTTSEVGLIGGGNILKPGEISLAHHGILFLDELPEFSRSTLEALRQPLEDGVVTLSRAVGSATYPAQFMLVAAANPCPCGWYNSQQKECNCTPHQVEQYKKRISGPLLDRIDMHIAVKTVDPRSLTHRNTECCTKEFRKHIQQARDYQQSREKQTGVFLNAHIPSKHVFSHCNVTLEAIQLLQKAAKSMALSARSYFKLLKVSRTIADLIQSESVLPNHVAEALQYRQL